MTLPVAAPPVFWTQRLAVTVSPGSIDPLTLQLSAASPEGDVVTRAAGVRHASKVAAPPAVTVRVVPVVAKPGFETETW